MIAAIRPMAAGPASREGIARVPCARPNGCAGNVRNIAPAERGLTSTSAVIRGFFALTLFGAGDEALLHAPHELFPEARFEPVPE